MTLEAFAVLLFLMKCIVCYGFAPAPVGFTGSVKFRDGG